MSILYLLVLVEPAIGLAGALVLVAIIARRAEPELARRRLVVTVVGGVVLTLLLLVRLWSVMPWFPVLGQLGVDFDAYQLTTFLVPLAAGTILVVVAGWPFRGAVAPGRATLEPRGPFAAARTWWLVGVGALLVASAALAIAAGLASSPDDTGRYTQYDVPVGAGFAGGTSIYGWYYSVPSGVAGLVLLIAFVTALVLSSRTTLRVDPELEGAIRRHRARQVTAATAGALFAHLGVVLASLRSTASITLTFAIDSGPISIVSPFAALGPALGVVAAIATVCGWALWWFVVLSAVRGRRMTATT